MHTLIDDLRYGLRMLRKSPGFAMVAILTLALGIGANTAIFSVVNGVLLNPLPFRGAHELMALGENKPNFENGSISYPNFRDWQVENRTFTAVALSRVYAFGLTGSGDAEQLNGDFVSSEWFPLLGIRPLLGRTFTPEEDQVGAAPVALISASLWRRKFDSSRDIVGRSISLDARAYTVVGVIADGFRLTLPSFRSGDVYVPVGQWSNPLLLHRGAGLGFHGLARLKPGVSIEQARADMERVTGNLAVAYPDVDKGISASVVPLKQRMIGDIQPLLLVLLAAVGFVLLIACANVANLLLARSTARRREFAIRAALGATQRRVLRQLLTESVLLALAGGGCGLVLAFWGTRAALGILPRALPRAEEVGLDTHVLLFASLTSLLAGVLFGLAPAWKVSRPDLHSSLQEGGRGVVPGRHRSQGLFVVAEMALALVLLIGAGLMIRSLTRLWHVDPGFDPSRTLSFGLSLPPSEMRASPDAIRNAFREFDRRIAAIPGVRSVSQSWGSVPMSDDDEQLFWLEGHPKPANQNEMNWGIDYIVEPSYLETMGIPLRQGRFFTSQDDEHSPLVTVVDEVFARKFFPNQDPIGKRFHLSGSDRLVEIVGVVGHVRQWGLDLDDQQSLRSEFYLPCMQMPDEFIAMAPSGSVVLVRSRGSLAGLFDSIRDVSRQMSSQQVIYGVQSMDQVISTSLASRRFSMILLAVFAALALLLATVGIYGVISYLVSQRVHEMGIRMALGARPLDILRLVLEQAGRMALAGVALGLILALSLTRLMAGLLYGVPATDPITFAAVAVLLAGVAMAACYFPARRATRVDPMVALRYE